MFYNFFVTQIVRMIHAKNYEKSIYVKVMAKILLVQPAELIHSFPDTVYKIHSEAKMH